MSDGFRIDTDELLHHSEVISGDVDSLREASTAASATGSQVAGGAFGLMCSFLAPPVGVAAVALGLQIDACASAETQLADALGAAADSFEHTEVGVTDMIDAALAGLG